MENQEYLNEKSYQKNKKKISIFATIVLIVGLLIGGGLITLGIINNNKINSQYSDENKSNIKNKLNEEKEKLELMKKELENKGISYNEFASYTDGEKYELKIITKSLDPSFDYCKFDEYKNNSVTSNYCLLKNELEDLNNIFNKRLESNKNIPFFIFGIFVIISSFMISMVIYMFTKRREILSFTAQQVIPIAQEGIEKITPTIGKVGKTLAEEMAPVYRNMAEEITKGIKDGLKDDENK